MDQRGALLGGKGLLKLQVSRNRTYVEKNLLSLSPLRVFGISV